ncbi:MAG: hypothetical protein K2N43_02305 [Lachnospiraceae bacterium]|nr:hypothetical protein [Lachnospiraceae bacterium]
MDEQGLILALSDLLDEKLGGLEQKVDGLEQKVDGLEQKVDGLEQRMDGLEQSMESVQGRVTRIEVDLLENNVIPRLNTIEACYTSTYNRYREYSERMETAFTDIDLLKKVVSEHSEKLKRIS